MSTRKYIFKTWVKQTYNRQHTTDNRQTKHNASKCECSVYDQYLNSIHWITVNTVTHRGSPLSLTLSTVWVKILYIIIVHKLKSKIRLNLGGFNRSCHGQLVIAWGHRPFDRMSYIFLNVPKQLRKNCKIVWQSWFWINNVGLPQRGLMMCQEGAHTHNTVTRWGLQETIRKDSVLVGFS